MRNYNFPPYPHALRQRIAESSPHLLQNLAEDAAGRWGTEGVGVASLRDAPVQRPHPYPTLHFVGVGLLEFRASGTRGWLLSFCKLYGGIVEQVPTYLHGLIDFNMDICLELADIDEVGDGKLRMIEEGMESTGEMQVFG